MASRVFGNLKNTSSRFEWEIPSYRIAIMDVDNFLKSPIFTASGGNIRCHMRLYPRGLANMNGTVHCQEHFLFYLICLDEKTSFFVPMLEFKIINDKGEDITKYTDADNMPPFLLGAKCVSRSFVENPANGIFENGTIKFVFEVTFSPSKKQKIKGKNATNNQQVEDDLLPRLEAIDKYEALLANSKFSDVSLVSEGKTMKMHKCILAQSSSVFAAMFDAEMKEKQENIVEIADIKYGVLVEMLRFIYAGKANDIDTLAGELAVAADKYALDGLKNACEKTMTKNLGHNNVIDYLQLADRLRMDKLREMSIKFIVENANDISNKPEFNLLPCDIVCEVFRCLAKKK